MQQFVVIFRLEFNWHTCVKFEWEDSFVKQDKDAGRKGWLKFVYGGTGAPEVRIGTCLYAGSEQPLSQAGGGGASYQRIA